MTASTGYRFEKGCRLTASLDLASASIRSLQEKANGLVGSSVGVPKNIITDKLSFSALVNNPFTTFCTNQIETAHYYSTLVRVVKHEPGSWHLIPPFSASFLA
ncbi:hypothetical protein GCM10028818_52320 [Spirosoma horti]